MKKYVVSKTDNDVENCTKVSDKDGFYYGKNAILDNDIFFDRKCLMPPHGLIVGGAGSGKTLSAIQEIEQVLDKTDDSVIIIGEKGYYLSDESRVISISPYDSVSAYHINPLDMYITEYDEDVSAQISVIADRAIILFEEIFCKTITNAEKCIVNGRVMELFEPFVKKLKENNVKFNYADNPTLSDIAELLLSKEETDISANVREKLSFIKEYFSYKTVMPNDMAIMLTWKDVPHLNSAFYVGCVMFSWNRLVEKHEEREYLWIYLEEFDSILREKKVNILALVHGLLKSSRRFGGIVTLISQSVEQLRYSKERNDFLKQLGFIRCLACKNHNELNYIREVFGLNDDMLNCINNAHVGGGLFITPLLVVPVLNRI